MGGAPGGETPLPVLDVTVLGLVGGAPGGETPRVADSSAAGAGRFFHNSVPPYLLLVVLASACETLGLLCQCQSTKKP